MDQEERNEVLMWIGRHPKCTVEDVIEETGIDKHELYELMKLHKFVLKNRTKSTQNRSRRIGHWER
ncbi:MAG: hypothetical protein CL448_02665 [Acidimicrobiaceae bacterium]|nr:hypothetical protein [Acidimicrobiaceae bacterium]